MALDSAIEIPLVANDAASLFFLAINLNKIKNDILSLSSIEFDSKTNHLRLIVSF